MSDTSNKKIYIGSRANRYGKYDALIVFGGSYLLAQLFGTIILLATNSQIIATFSLQIAFILFALIYSKNNGINLAEAIRFNKLKIINIPLLLILAPAMMCVMIPIQELWANFLINIGLNPGSVDFGTYDTIAEKIVYVFVLSVGPMFGEEIVFRGVVANGFASDKGKIKAIFLSAGLFALMHSNPMQLWNPLVLGIVFAYVMFKTNSIIAASLLHFANNFTVCMLDIFASESFMNSYEQNMWWFFLIGIVVAIGIIIAIYFLNRENKIDNSVVTDEDVEFVSAEQMTYKERVLSYAAAQGLDNKRRTAWILFVGAALVCLSSIVLICLGLS